MQTDAVTVTRYVNWLPAYYEGRLTMVPPGRTFALGDTLPELPPTEEAPAAAPPAPPAPPGAGNATANATAPAAGKATVAAAAPAPAAKVAEAPKPKKTEITIKTYDNWQAAFLDGYGFPAAGQKLPKAPNATANGTANATAGAKGARRLLARGEAAPREPLV